MNRLLSGFILISVGLSAGFLLHPFIQQQAEMAGLTGGSNDTDSTEGGRKILYWVAPMDPNFRKDKPGLSTMGMDLVPFYEGGEDDEAGVVSISPTVQNNIGVRTSIVKKGQLDRTINTVGYVTVDEEKLHHIHTRVEGWVEKLSVKSKGDKVKKGQKLFELYSPTLVNAQEEYVTALKSKNRLLIKASRARLEALGIATKQIKRLNKTRKVKQTISYYAVQSCFLEKLKVREGMFVKPSLNVISIAQIDTVWVIAEVFERQSNWVKTGQKVEISLEAFPARLWTGVVDYIYPILDMKTRTLRVRIRVDNKDNALKPNMFANLKILSSMGDNLVYVPRESIISNGQMDRVVKVLGDGKFKSVVVRTGDESDGNVTILDGLNEGEKIVISAQFLIDSESSLTASFNRMEEPMGNTMDATMDMSNDDIPNAVWVYGVIESIDQKAHALKIKYEAISIWEQDEMTRVLPVKTGLSIDEAQVGNRILFYLEKQKNGRFEIINFPKPWVNKPMDMENSQ